MTRSKRMTPEEREDWLLMTPMEKRLFQASRNVPKVDTPPYYPGQPIGHSELYAYKTRHRDYK